MLAGGATTGSSDADGSAPASRAGGSLGSGDGVVGAAAAARGQRRRCGFGRARLAHLRGRGCCRPGSPRPPDRLRLPGTMPPTPLAPVAARPPPASSRATSSRALGRAKSMSADSLARAIGWSPLRWHCASSALLPRPGWSRDPSAQFGALSRHPARNSAALPGASCQLHRAQRQERLPAWTPHHLERILTHSEGQVKLPKSKQAS